VDFALDDTQRTIASVARETLAREPAGSAWKALARAGLLSLAVPVDLGGEGLGVLETAVVLTEIGRAAAILPAETLILVPFVTDQALRSELASGERTLAAAVRARRPATVDGGRVSGAWIGVAEADHFLVPAGDRVFLVDATDPRVSRTRTPTSSGRAEFTLGLDAVAAAPLDIQPDNLRRLMLAGACAVGDGLVAGALDLTAAHIRTREQFGRPLATFQAVAQQIAEVYVTSRTLHLTALSACWRLAEGRDPDADLEVAGYWLTAEALPALHICHHLHGGLGVDASYPLHRYYSLAKDLVRSVGGAEHRLEVLAHAH
jgi:alkylation response protein AidB-like acyl-CoA dehydrogenase